ncbi:cytochrome c-type biogenesis protein [Scleromatobacter humisilvae]|uniref:Cytochrome c-type biogenesis protein n=1 Tax=Scleromatobacter humisilvae TaxID=2897159 RepID=A0A9X1YNI8_9BURK|nr:cytochrome c-type biogenesis protein [Scleromatobacter humisilvae]MCK9687652.1 cytochrome c-type biogenesis protein CcmH [Scleromatobacter humisilvae]
MADARRIGLAALLACAFALPTRAADAPASAPSAAASDATVKFEAPTARLTAADPALEARMLAITGELRCLVCQNQTIADSHADLAADLRQEVREMLQKGQTPEQIRKYMTDRYGDFVLYRPPLKATTAVLWLAPATLLAIALAALALVIHRRSRLADDEFEPEPMLDDEPAADPLARPGTLA